jgi:hypothetical protein
MFSANSSPAAEGRSPPLQDVPKRKGSYTKYLAVTITFSQLQTHSRTPVLAETRGDSQFTGQSFGSWHQAVTSKIPDGRGRMMLPSVPDPRGTKKADVGIRGGFLIFVPGWMSYTSLPYNRPEMGPDTWSTWKCEFDVKPIFSCVYAGVKCTPEWSSRR